MVETLIEKHIKNKLEFKFITAGLIHCNACSQDVTIRRNAKYCLSSHEISKKHKRNMGLWLANNQPIQQSISNCMSLARNVNEFYRDTAAFLCFCNIPFHKLSYKSFKDYIKKWVGKEVPDESTLRKNYLKKLYEDSIASVREAIGDKWIYLIVDESSDPLDRPLVSIIVGPLDGSPPRSYLLDIAHLDAPANSRSICRVVMEALRILWPDKIQYDRVRLIVSDQASYMVKAAFLLKASSFKDLLHVSCLAHALHRVSEAARVHYKSINELVSNFKSTFVRCDRRRQILVDEVKKPFPKLPIITRWGTWIEFCVYLAENFDATQVAINKMRGDDCQALEELLKNMETTGAKQILLAIAELRCLPKTIRELETRGLEIGKVREMIDNVRLQLPDIFKLKLDCCLAKNPNFKSVFELPEMAQECFRFAPLVSVEVERSFSQLKLILTDRRLRFTLENFKFYAVSYYNSIE